MDINQELIRIAKTVIAEIDAEEAFTAEIAKKLFGLRKKYGIGSIRQNYKGTGSQKARRQIFVRLENGENIDVFLDADHYQLGGVTINRIRGDFPYGTKTSSEIAEAIGSSLQQAFGGKSKTASKDIKRIKIDWNSSNSISGAERQKSRLENQGYSLTQTLGGLSTSELVYSKESKTASSNDPLLMKVAALVESISGTSFMGWRKSLEGLKMGKIDSTFTNSGMTWTIKTRKGKIAIAKAGTVKADLGDIQVKDFIVGYL